MVDGYLSFAGSQLGLPFVLFATTPVCLFVDYCEIIYQLFEEVAEEWHEQLTHSLQQTNANLYQNRFAIVEGQMVL